jgi:chromosome segregation and condensation protein ScpB
LISPQLLAHHLTGSTRIKFKPCQRTHLEESFSRTGGISIGFKVSDHLSAYRGRPCDLNLVAGGYALRTKTRFAPAIRAAPGLGRYDVAELTRTETFALTAIAYLQPVTRGEISRLAGREISRDVIASLKRAIRAPQPGVPFAYVTTWKFLEAFGFASLRDLPDLEQLKAVGNAHGGQGGARLGHTWRSGRKRQARSA